MFTFENALLVGSILLFVSIIAGKTGYRFGVPTLLLFLVVGMIFGSDGLGLQFHDAGEAQFIGMVALSVILFSGGMDTRYADIRPIVGPGLMLSTLGVLFTTLLTGGFIWWLSGLAWTNIHFGLTASLLLAATMSSTDSASVFAILRTQKMSLRHHLRPMLELESGSNDPMAYMLTILLIQCITTTGMTATEMAQTFVMQIAIGGAMGFLLGRMAVYALNHLNIDNQALYPILLLSFIFFIFAFTDLTGGNGYLAVYLAGMIVGNSRFCHRREINTFMDGLSWLCQICMFLCLGLLVNPHEMLDVAAVALLVALFMIFAGRPLSVFLCLLPFRRRVNLRAGMFVAWVGLRGAVPIIFATYPVVADVPQASLLFNMVFFITIVSLIVQGTSIGWAARNLQLALPLPQTGNGFGVELPEETGTELSEMLLTPELLAQGNTLRTMQLPKGKLVMMVKRGGKYLVPDGKMPLLPDDRLLLISSQTPPEPDAPATTPTAE